MALLAEEVVSLSKSVQEMSVDGDEPPSRYIVKDSFLGSADDPSPYLCPFPILDISHFSSPSSSFPKTEVDKVLQKLKSALSSSGCFQAIGHGISSSFVDKVRDVTKQFFALPETEKQKYARAVNESEGYGSDRIVSDKQVLDWSHRLILRVFPEDKRRFNLWPENPNDFRDIMDEYASKIKVVTDIMSNGIFKSPVHRVVTNSEKLRISVALFNEPEPENEIGAVDGLVDENRPRTAVQTTTGQNSFACRTSSQAAKHPHCLTSNMAGMPLSSDGVSLSRSIQEMSMNGDEPPPEFYVKDSSFTHTDYSDLSASISVPVIDISLLLSSKDELEKLRQALSSGGCFQAIGHGISNSFIDKVREIAKQFFGLPQEEKQKYSRAVNEVEGYGHDLIVSEKQVLDWNSRLFLRIMSNGIFKSPMHRVVTNTDKLRISVAMFNEAEPDKEIGPVEGLIDDNRPRLYRNVKNYASFNYECFQKGKVALEEVKFHA
ncbi:Non-hem dioxygenase N-terminal domain - like 10 [Theobroma cacao]|nr:Non-hem dioxygenase N-terminal domain - like 10 [Theobroma cacao]